MLSDILESWGLVGNCVDIFHSNWSLVHFSKSQMQRAMRLLCCCWCKPLYSLWCNRRQDCTREVRAPHLTPIYELCWPLRLISAADLWCVQYLRVDSQRSKTIEEIGDAAHWSLDINLHQLPIQLCLQKEYMSMSLSGHCMCQRSAVEINPRCQPSIWNYGWNSLQKRLNAIGILHWKPYPNAV